VIRATFRPIDDWPGVLRSDTDRENSRFKAHHADTLDLLQRELDQLDAVDIIIQVALTDRDIRNDGWPRSDSRPSHPGVIVSFDSKHGPLKYATDIYRGTGAPTYWGTQTGWKANLRAIALGLEALRKVDRYGITKRGEQYRGWKALGAGEPIALGGSTMTVDEAARFIAEHSDDPAGRLVDVADDPLFALALYRDAAKTLHPDAGGDPELFKRLQDAKAILDQAAA
jgi:hypothetical protein